jgi:hypothetical protein
MKPVKVGPGEYSEYESLLKRATDLEKAVDNAVDHDVKFEDVSGTNVRAQHYWTNQEQPDVPETITNKGAVFDKNPPGLTTKVPHQYSATGSTLSSHITGGSDIRKSELLGAWREDDPFSINAIVNEVEELTRHL